MPAPSPEDAEHALFIVKWWKEFFLGLGALLGVFAVVKKGQKVPVVIPDKELESRINLEMELRLQVCRQSILLDLNRMLDERDEKLLNRIEKLLE